MSADRAGRLSATLGVLGIICLAFDQDFIFNGLDLLVLILAGASIGLLLYSKELD